MTGDLLAQLQHRQATSVAPSVRPASLPVEAIKTYAEVFQPRDVKLNAKHVADLERAVVARKGKLDAVTVMWLGPEVVLVDGHHRHAAYRRVNRKAGAKAFEVPVEWFEGTVLEAVLLAGKANSATKLNMQSRERQNYAWRLVLSGQFSRSQIVEAADVADGQVAKMRRAAKQLGAEAADCTEWLRAKALAEHRGEPRADFTPVDLEKRQQEVADRLVRHFAMTLTGNVEMAAGAVAIHFGRRFDDFVFACQQIQGEGDDPYADDEADEGETEGELAELKDF